MYNPSYPHPTHCFSTGPCCGFIKLLVICSQPFQAAHYNGLFHRVEGLVSDWKREDEEGHDVKDCFVLPKDGQTGATMFLKRIRSS